MSAPYYVIKLPGSSFREVDDQYIGDGDRLVDDIEEARIFDRAAALAVMSANPYAKSTVGHYAELVRIRPVEA